MIARRERCQQVLDAELGHWSTKSCDELMAELTDVHTYQVEAQDKTYQVEIQLLENTDKYLHVCIGVDDGSIPASFRPVSVSFVQEKAIH